VAFGLDVESDCFPSFLLPSITTSVVTASLAYTEATAIIELLFAMLSFGIPALGSCRDISDIIYDENLCGNASVIARPTDMFCNNVLLNAFCYHRGV
jgi:hypothetical protein